MTKTNYKYCMLYLRENYLKFQINEDSSVYDVKSPNNMHDKLFRDLLGDTREAAKFINKYLGIKTAEEELEKYNSSFITDNYQNSEADIVYKLKNKKVFILIEHQSSLDYSMPYRLLKYNMEIIRDTNDNNNYKNKGYIYAKVIPIVVYTGGRKWNASRNFSIQQAKFENRNYLELEYNLIDINDYDRKQLLEGDTMIEKAMLIEKSKNEDDLKAIIEDVFDVINYNDEAQVDKIRRIINYALMLKMKEETGQEFINKIDKNMNQKNFKEEYNMLWDRLRLEEERWKREATKKGRKEGIREGIRENIMATIQRMLQFGENDEKIQKYTGASKEDIEQAKKLLSAKS